MNQDRETIQTVSKGHRLAIFFFSVLLTILLIWLGNFVLRDINSLKRVDTTQIYKKYEDLALEAEKKALERKIDGLKPLLQDAEETHQYLKASTEESQNAVQQLSEIRSQSLAKDVAILAAEAEAFAESQTIFVENQKKLQDVIADLRRLKSEKREAELELGRVKKRIDKAHEPAREEARAASRRREHLAVLVKLCFALPLLLLGVFLLVKTRGTRFANIVYPLNIASLWILFRVIHDYFPATYYKYIFIGAALAAALAMSVYLVRLAIRPGRKWLLKKHQEAYREGKCPVCQHPVQRGRLKYTLSGKKLFKSVLPVSVYAQGAAEDYTCPSCGVRVFETCPQCKESRHALLEFCQHCGDKKPWERIERELAGG
jgi:hypothetical protein